MSKKPATPVLLGKNVTASIENNVLTLQVDLTQDQGKSASGKSTVIGTTSGNKSIGGVTVGVNVYK